MEERRVEGLERSHPRLEAPPQTGDRQGCVECFPGRCEALSSVPGTAEMGRGANTVILALRKREQQFRLILGYIVSLRSVRATWKKKWGSGRGIVASSGLGKDRVPRLSCPPHTAAPPVHPASCAHHPKCRPGDGPEEGCCPGV